MYSFLFKNNTINNLTLSATEMKNCPHHKLHISKICAGFIIIVFIASCHSVKGQEPVETTDSITQKTLPLSEFSLGRKMGNAVSLKDCKYYDFGISLNLLIHKGRSNTCFGINPFFDIHVIDNRGYNKLGFRLFSEFKLSSEKSSEESIKIAVGPSWSNSFNNGYSASNASPFGLSGEFSYFISPGLGISARWDRFQIPAIKDPTAVNDFSIGLKIRPRGLISALGYLFGIGSLGFNSILRSQ
jgi:hypothetical protein